ncbi:MAG: type II toxin-antitoxin system VapC family toxin [Vulcanimicrobiota bacterium]
MSGKLMLDTNIVISLFAGDERVEKLIGEAEFIVIPAIVLGELYYGAFNSRLKDQNLTRINEFVSACPVVGTNAATALEYGRIKNSLKQSGTPIPENDIWIAALASQYGFRILTRDEHFLKIDGIDLCAV